MNQSITSGEIAPDQIAVSKNLRQIILALLKKNKLTDPKTGETFCILYMTDFSYVDFTLYQLWVRNFPAWRHSMQSLSSTSRIGLVPE